MKYTLLTLGLMLVVSCASHPKTIEAAYVSPLKYKDNSCDQLDAEMGQVAQRTGRLYQSLMKESNADSWQMGLGLVVFWPTLLLLEGGDGAEASEFATLKGEYQALHEISVEKDCVITTKSPDDMFNAFEEEKKETTKKSKREHFIR